MCGVKAPHFLREKNVSKINKKVAIFIVFLILVVIYGLWQTPITNIITQNQRPDVSGLYIEFQNGTTEPEVKAIIEKCNMTVNYTIYYNTKKFIRNQVQGNSVICYIQFGDGSGNYIVGKNCITWSDENKIKDGLKKNKKVLTVIPQDIKY